MAQKVAQLSSNPGGEEEPGGRSQEGGGARVGEEGGNGRIIQYIYIGWVPRPTISIVVEGLVSSTASFTYLVDRPIKLRTVLFDPFQMYDVQTNSM